jgi:hypothetical protein
MLRDEEEEEIVVVAGFVAAAVGEMEVVVDVEDAEVDEGMGGDTVTVAPVATGVPVISTSTALWPAASTSSGSMWW